MEKLWTKPAIIGVLCAVLSAVCAPISIAIALRSLDISKRQLAIQEGQRSERQTEQVNPTASTTSNAPLIAASVLSLTSISTALFTFLYVRRRAKAIAATANKRVFSITKADWGNPHRRERIEDALRAMPSNALAFYVCPDTLRPYTSADKADPAPGPGKYVEITYSSGPSSGTIVRDEGQWVVLPEDPFMQTEIKKLKQELERNAYVQMMEISDSMAEDNLADIDDAFYNRIRAHFIPPHLKYGERLALQFLLSSPGYALSPGDLCTRLQNCDYPGDVAWTFIRELVDGSIIVDTNRHADIDTVLIAPDTEISIKSPDIARILKKLFKENPLLPN